MTDEHRDGFKHRDTGTESGALIVIPASGVRSQGFQP